MRKSHRNYFFRVKKPRNPHWSDLSDCLHRGFAGVPTTAVLYRSRYRSLAFNQCKVVGVRSQQRKQTFPELFLFVSSISKSSLGSGVPRKGTFFRKFWVERILSGFWNSIQLFIMTGPASWSGLVNHWVSLIRPCWTLIAVGGTWPVGLVN